MTEALSQRGLNRATLARQHLLERARARAIDAIEIRDQSLRIQPFVNLRPADRDALLAEAAQLLAFVAPRANPDIILEKPEPPAG